MWEGEGEEEKEGERLPELEVLPVRDSAEVVEAEAEEVPTST